METIAIYWEDKIRTYGLNLLEGLALYCFTLPSDRIGQWGAALRSPDNADPAFRLLWAQAEPCERIRICLVCDKIHCHSLRSVLDHPAGHWETCDPAPVDLIYFQGPHFGDRYGIMDFTLRALAPEQAPILATVCAMATIYLVLPSGWGRKACDRLNRAFEIPKTAARKGKKAADGGEHR